MAQYLVQLEFLLRVALAAVCGALIGYERKNRLKEAGVRTHMIVALGAALIMVVSKYGFADVLGGAGVALDPSRIAAQVVSGIGFLGAGMIFVRGLSVSGLTTAAGIWATAGVGMAMGAGLYAMGATATVLILLIQIILHRNFKWLPLPASEMISVTFSESADAISFVQQTFAGQSIEIINLKAEKSGDGLLNVDLYVKLPARYDVSRLMDLFKNNPHVRAITYEPMPSGV